MMIILPMGYDCLATDRLSLAEIFTHDGQVGKRKVFLHDVADEDQDKHRVQGHGRQRAERLVAPAHSQEENGRQNHIEGDVLQRIIHRIILLSEHVTGHHADTIGRKTGPRTRHIAEPGDEKHVDKDEHHATQTREISAPNGAVGELIPETEVEINAKHDLRGHDNGDDTQAFPIVGSHHMAHNIHVTDDRKKGQKRENDVIFHHLGVGFLLIGALIGKYKRLIRKAEGLRYDDHYHGYLYRTAVNAELGIGFLRGAIVEIRKQQRGSALVQLARYAEDKHGPSVAKHAFAHVTVEPKADTFHLLKKQQRRNDTDKEVQIEHDSHIGNKILVVNAEDIDTQQGEYDEEKSHQRSIDEDVGALERGKLHGLMPVAKIVKHDTRPRVYGHANGHRTDVPRVFAIAHKVGQGLKKQDNEHREGHCHGTNHAQCRGVNHAGILPFLVGEAEKGGLHAERKGYDKDSYVGIDIRDNTILPPGGAPCEGLYGHKKVVDKACRNAADTIYSGIFQ